MPFQESSSLLAHFLVLPKDFKVGELTGIKLERDGTDNELKIELRSPERQPHCALMLILAAPLLPLILVFYLILVLFVVLC